MTHLANASPVHDRPVQAGLTLEPVQTVGAGAGAGPGLIPALNTDVDHPSPVGSPDPSASARPARLFPTIPECRRRIVTAPQIRPSSAASVRSASLSSPSHNPGPFSFRPEIDELSFIRECVVTRLYRPVDESGQAGRAPSVESLTGLVSATGEFHFLF